MLAPPHEEFEQFGHVLHRYPVGCSSEHRAAHGWQLAVGPGTRRHIAARLLASKDALVRLGADAEVLAVDRRMSEPQMLDARIRSST